MTVRRTAAAALAALFALPLAAGGCQGDCCTVDSFSIPLGRAPSGAPLLPNAFDAGADAPPLPDGGALLALAGPPGGPPGITMVVDTASPFTVMAGPSTGALQTRLTGFDLYGVGVPPTSEQMSPPLRGKFRNWDVLTFPLSAVGDGSGEPPGGVLGADVLRGYSVDLRLAGPCPASLPGTCASMTLWHRLAPDQAFLEDAGYAVLAFTPYGGGEITAQGDPDFLGLRGPVTVPPTRVVLRACAVPAAFSPVPDPLAPPPPPCCTAADALAQATGVDLSLLVDTGIGPLVLSASAWARVVANAAARTPALPLPPLPDAPSPSATPLRVATWPAPIDVLLWAAIPRFALVNLEAGANNDPGPCVELGRSRRTELVSYATVNAPDLHICGQRCDRDPNQTGLAQNSAAYLEINGNIPVAVIADNDPFLQALRFDVLPEGPELDGLVGAAALGAARVELDYLSSPGRAVFSCETGVPRSSCWAAARCPQLPDSNTHHDCFGLGFHGLPESCAPSTCP
ncbi:MAG TPA: hypothetical protein VHM31_16095 [Polyangia bacterium]|nr:hypothetical protein [Polyangia bacterium]